MSVSFISSLHCASHHHEHHVQQKEMNPQVSLQCGTQVYPDATSDENSGCKTHSGQGMGETRDDPSLELGKSQEQKESYLDSTKR